MSRLRFLADHDFNEHIIDGLLRREPSVEISRVRDHGLREQPDAVILEFAADNRLLVLSHDVNTMPAAAYARIDAAREMPGLLMVKQSHPIAPVIESLALMWSASEPEEWDGHVWFLPL
jgi:hypothetical protein